MLTLRRAAKNTFDEYLTAHPDQKSLPRVKELNAEYSEIQSRKKKSYQSYRAVRKENEEWQIARALLLQFCRRKLARKRNSTGSSIRKNHIKE